MKVLIIGGLNLHLTDETAYWRMADDFEAAGHQVRCRECIQNHNENSVTFDDLMWADEIVAYSYGTASAWKLWHDNIEKIGDKRWQRLCILCGVPDAFMAQLYPGLWHSPTFVERAICYNVISVPVSCTLQNTGVVNVSFAWGVPDAPAVNVSCDWMGFNHVSIKESPAVLDSITQWILRGAA
jgi:hypothetical protein